MNFGAIEIIWNDEYKLNTIIKLQAKDKEGKIVIERNITLNELQQYYLRNRITISIIISNYHYKEEECKLEYNDKYERFYSHLKNQVKILAIDGLIRLLIVFIIWKIFLFLFKRIRIIKQKNQ